MFTAISSLFSSSVEDGSTAVANIAVTVSSSEARRILI